MSNFTPEELAQLRAPFPIDWHIIREGYKVGGKMRWFVYIDRSAVQDLLDHLFPGEWETSEPKLYLSQGTYTDYEGKEKTIQLASATVGIIIRGIARYDGGDSDGDESTKGALTNAFRRTAAYGWGIGRYLYDMTTSIETDVWQKNDWKKRNECRDSAWKQFTEWYKQQFGIPAQPAQKPPTGASASANVSTQAQAPENAQTGELRAFDLKGFETRMNSDEKLYYRFEARDGTFILTFGRDLFRAFGYPDAQTEGWKKPGFKMAFPKTIDAKWMAKDGTDGYWLAVVPKTEEVTF